MASIGAVTWYHNRPYPALNFPRRSWTQPDYKYSVLFHPYNPSYMYTTPFVVGLHLHTMCCIYTTCCHFNNIVSFINIHRHAFYIGITNEINIIYDLMVSQALSLPSIVSFSIDVLCCVQIEWTNLLWKRYGLGPQML